LIPNR